MARLMPDRRDTSHQNHMQDKSVNDFPDELDSSTQHYPTSVWRDLAALGIKFIAIVITFAIIFTFVFAFHQNADPDMSPIVNTGDLILLYRMGRNYAIGDLLVLNFQGERQIRRVVARATDIVDIENGCLIVNGATQQEPNIYEETWRYESGIDFPLTVGAGQVFVLGDARKNATDSRVYGPVSIEDTLGTVITVVRHRNL